MTMTHEKRLKAKPVFSKIPFSLAKDHLFPFLTFVQVVELHRLCKAWRHKFVKDHHLWSTLHKRASDFMEGHIFNLQTPFIQGMLRRSFPMRLASDGTFYDKQSSADPKSSEYQSFVRPYVRCACLLHILYEMIPDTKDRNYLSQAVGGNQPYCMEPIIFITKPLPTIAQDNTKFWDDPDIMSEEDEEYYEQFVPTEVSPEPKGLSVPKCIQKSCTTIRRMLPQDGYEYTKKHIDKYLFVRPKDGYPDGEFDITKERSERMQHFLNMCRKHLKDFSELYANNADSEEVGMYFLIGEFSDDLMGGFAFLKERDS